MSIVIFSGPTLWNDPVQGAAGFTWLPPARRGDLLRAAAERPFAIGLIDGCFETVPSVWHKEILWALAHGVHVFGAASLGALRAAELARYGMRGVGSVYAQYVQGTLERDDAVAVLHAPAAHCFQPITEALVDMTATLDRAAAEGVLDAASARRLAAIAAATFFKERTWNAVLVRARGRNGGRRLARFRCWLKLNRVEAKRADARQMLVEISAFAAATQTPFDPRGLDVPATSLWRVLEEEVLGSPPTALNRMQPPAPRGTTSSTAFGSAR
jgi:hypothetical protein